MLTRNWFAATALAVGLLALPLYAQESGQGPIQGKPETASKDSKPAPAGEQNAKPEDRSASEFLPALKGIEAAIRDLIADEDKIAGEAARRREQDDLQAQQEMALWAFWMVVAAAVSTFLTAVGIFLIWRTLHHTRRAADYTKDMLVDAKRTTDAALMSADQAREANILSEETAYKSLRAYIGYDSCEISQSEGFTYITMRVRNFGQTPADIRAYLVQYHIDLLIQGGGTEIILAGGNGGGPYSLSPNAVISFYNGGFKFPDVVPAGARFILIVDLTYIYNDMRQKQTTVSVQVCSRINKIERGLFRDNTMNLLSQSETIHPDYMIAGIGLILEESAEKEAKKAQKH